MMVLWAWAGVPLGAYNIVRGFNVALQVQPQILTAMSLLTWGQCVYYQRVSSAGNFSLSNLPCMIRLFWLSVLVFACLVRWVLCERSVGNDEAVVLGSVKASWSNFPVGSNVRVFRCWGAWMLPPYAYASCFGIPNTRAMPTDSGTQTEDSTFLPPPLRLLC